MGSFVWFEVERSTGSHGEVGRIRRTRRVSRHVLPLLPASFVIRVCLISNAAPFVNLAGVQLSCAIRPFPPLTGMMIISVARLPNAAQSNEA